VEASTQAGERPCCKSALHSVAKRLPVRGRGTHTHGDKHLDGMAEIEDAEPERAAVDVCRPMGCVEAPPNDNCQAISSTICVRLCWRTLCLYWVMRLPACLAHGRLALGGAICWLGRTSVGVQVGTQSAVLGSGGRRHFAGGM
jgi:hypothetical protein